MGLINQFRDLWQPLGVNQKISLVLASPIPIRFCVICSVLQSR